MIRETIVTTSDAQGNPHIAPMGIHIQEAELVFVPFRPSGTLDNLLSERCAAINYTDDVRVFAGCLTGRYDWPLCRTEEIDGFRLKECQTHCEVQIERFEDDEVRPRLFGRVVSQRTHAPFLGFNRAQSAVIEAAILVSRLHLLPWEKIMRELDYLKIAVEKTAGERETEAWDWLMAAVAAYRSEESAKSP